MRHLHICPFNLWQCFGATFGCIRSLLSGGTGCASFACKLGCVVSQERGDYSKNQRKDGNNCPTVRVKARCGARNYVSGYDEWRGSQQIIVFFGGLGIWCLWVDFLWRRIDPTQKKQQRHNRSYANSQSQYRPHARVEMSRIKALCSATYVSLQPVEVWQ
jgi:hypothetical protein